jgi:hypothetical protein
VAYENAYRHREIIPAVGTIALHGEEGKMKIKETPTLLRHCRFIKVFFSRDAG